MWGELCKREDYRQIPPLPTVLTCFPFVLAEIVLVAVFSIAVFSGSRLGYLGHFNPMFPFSPLICPSLRRHHCYLLHISRSQAECGKLYFLCFTVRTIHVSFF